MGINFDVGNVVNGVIGLYTSAKNLKLQGKWSKMNYELQKQAQDESMFMNRNQFQVQSADALKAGINPLAMSGGQVSTASAQNVDAPQLDTSQLSNVIGTILNFKHDEKMQKNAQEFQASEDEKQRKHEELITSLKIASENKRHSQSLEQSQKQFDANLAETVKYRQQIERIENSKLSRRDKEIEIDRARLNIERFSADALNALRIQQKYLNAVELRKSARDLASQILSGFSTDKSGMYGFFERVFSQQMADGVRRGTSSRKLTPDELAEHIINALKDEDEK